MPCHGAFGQMLNLGSHASRPIHLTQQKRKVEVTRGFGTRLELRRINSNC